MPSKYKIAVCQLFNPYTHGLSNTSDCNIMGHYLIIVLIDPQEFFNSYSEYDNYDNYYLGTSFVRRRHPTIRNYHIIHLNMFNKFQIVETDMLSGEELVGYIKTFWIKIFQRKWKKIFKTRKEIILQRKKIKNLRERELTGRFPQLARHYPLLQ